MDDAARVELRNREDLPEDYRELLGEDVMGELNLFRAIAHHPRALKAYMRYGTAMWHVGEFSSRERELAILAVAVDRQCPYEWQQHVPKGRDAGVSDAELRAIARRDYRTFTAREEAILRFASCVAAGTVSDPVFAATRERIGEADIVGLTMLASHYVMTARIIDSLALPLEEPFVGWDPSPNE